MFIYEPRPYTCTTCHGFSMLAVGHNVEWQNCPYNTWAREPYSSSLPPSLLHQDLCGQRTLSRTQNPRQANAYPRHELLVHLGILLLIYCAHLNFVNFPLYSFYSPLWLPFVRSAPAQSQKAGGEVPGPTNKNDDTIQKVLETRNITW